VRASEALAARLAERGLDCQVLNAVRHREEAQIVTGAGEAGRLTIATNMAGRGTDIALGPGVAELGGLHVISTEWHEAARIDRQLFGRGARQGDPGSVQAFASLEDALPLRYASAPLLRLTAAGLRAGLPGAEACALRLLSLAQHVAQKRAARQRRQLLEVDLWLDESLSFAGRTV
jgi:preprotein translocase subunit SecA